jgi:hypothetical protein
MKEIQANNQSSMAETCSMGSWERRPRSRIPHKDDEEDLDPDPDRLLRLHKVTCYTLIG